MKLLVGDKNDIQRRIVSYTFDAKEYLLLQQENLLAEEVWNERFSEADRLKMKNIPKDWLPTTTNIRTNVGGWYVDLSFQSMDPKLKNSYDRFLKRPVPNDADHKTYTIKDAGLLSKVQSFAQEKDKLNKDRSTFGYKIQSFLKSISTVARLFEEMPEIKEILGESYFTKKGISSMALAIRGTEILCEIASFRGEEREGCCDGKIA